MQIKKPYAKDKHIKTQFLQSVLFLISSENSIGNKKAAYPAGKIAEKAMWKSDKTKSSIEARKKKKEADQLLSLIHI